jgi:hypothetical protein
MAFIRNHQYVGSTRLRQVVEGIPLVWAEYIRPEESAVSFCPSDPTAPNKSHHPLLVIPTRISCHVALDRAACAPFRKERRMKCINATNLNRKSGGSAVRPGFRTKVSVPLVLPQNRHPERSASQLDRLTQRLWRGVEGPRRCSSYPCCSELFNHQAPSGGPPRFFPGAENQELASIL